VAPTFIELVQRVGTPLHPKLLTADTGVQDQMLQALSATLARTTEIALLDAAIGFDKGAVVLEVLLYLATQVDVAQHGRRPQSHEQRISDEYWVLSGGDPVSKMLHARLGDRIGAGPAPTLFLAVVERDEAGVG
jgi:hypothetical protein